MSKNVFKRKIGNKITPKEIKDLPFESPDKCDDLEWFVDSIAERSILLHLLKNKGWVSYSQSRGPNYDCYYSSAGELLEQNFKGQNNIPNGIFFKAGHWYIKSGNNITDSYKLGYQMRGTSHFCQTFALLHFLGKDDDMIQGDYRGNLLKAIKFWKKEFKADPELLNLVLKQVRGYWGRNSEKELLLEIQKICVPLKKRLRYFNESDMYKYLSYLKLRSDRYISCKEG